MKFSYCSRICETACGMTTYLSTYRVWQGKAYCTIQYQIQHGRNDFLTIFEAQAMLPLAVQMEGIYSNKKEEGSYRNLKG